jgi:hypothetical protein
MNIEEWLFTETDDTCAICGIRGNQILTVYHIDGNHDNNTYDNTIILCHNCHNQYHTRKGISQEQIIDRKKHLINKTLTQYGLNAMKIAGRNGFGVVAMPFLLFHLVQLGYMTKEENQMGYGKQDEATSRFAITPLGSELLRKWFR